MQLRYLKANHSTKNTALKEILGGLIPQQFSKEEKKRLHQIHIHMLKFKAI